ncbi:MAG TPA: thiamine phosphate synthase [Pyrinomonadaceae bacterium]|nr:thiamine phosphate synthase [Pyrinomonadaceae bacterium]
MKSSDPIVYLITPGRLTDENYDTKAGELLATIQFAIDEGVSHVQIREKALSARRLFDLVCKAAEQMRGSGTRLLVNDRADIAHLAGADGVHLTEGSVTAAVIRKHFPPEFIVAVSTHSLAEASEAKRKGADLAVFGPVFQSPEKGVAVGLDELRNVCGSLSPFPVVGLGGIDAGNWLSVVEAGASGIAAIRALNDPELLRAIMREIKE